MHIVTVSLIAFTISNNYFKYPIINYYIQFVLLCISSCCFSDSHNYTYSLRIQVNKFGDILTFALYIL